MSKQIRNGAKGALLDVYEKAIEELITVVSNIPNSALTVPLDMKTTDVNCKTIQSILSHVISSGYGYAISCLLYTSPSPRDRTRSRMPSSA